MPAWPSPIPGQECRSSFSIPPRSIVTIGVRSLKTWQASAPLFPTCAATAHLRLGASLPVGSFARVPDAPALTMAQLAADAIALLDHLAVPQAVFAGCSIGGYVLLELWRRVPERMSALAFICSKPQPDAEANLQKRVANIAQARAGEAAALFDGVAQTSIGATARRRRPQIVPELRARMTLTPEALVAVQAGLAARPDSVPTVATIGVPLMAIAGGEDSAVTPAEMEAFRDAPGSCEFHLLPDAGHFAAYEQPRKVASLLAAWLKQWNLNVASLMFVRQ